jgi:SAM-dependent methyltransferase
MTLDTEKMRPQHEIWNDLVGDAWVRHADLHDRQAAPFGDAVLAALGDIADATVLDVGCGTGATSRALAETGAREVVGVDLSEPMIAAARASTAHASVRYEACDVLTLDAADEFDVIFSRFGVMFFADPTAAFARLRSIGRPGARLGFCCWGTPADNPLMGLPVMAATPVLGPPVLARPGEPGPFSLPTADVIGEVLGASGWSEVVVDALTTVAPHPAGGADAVARVVVDFAPPIVEGLRRHPDRRTATIEAITEALRPCERDGIVHLQASALVVTAAG